MIHSRKSIAVQKFIMDEFQLAVSVRPGPDEMVQEVNIKCAMFLSYNKYHKPESVTEK